MSDYFQESVPDGISNIVCELWPETECCGQDGYELLTDVFGRDVNGDRFRSYTNQDCQKMAESIKEYFELDSEITIEQGRRVIDFALNQWAR